MVLLRCLFDMYIYLILLQILHLCHYSYERNGIFLELPTSVVVAAQDGGGAMFRCQADADAVVWRFNGSFVNYSNHDFERTSTLAPAGPRINTLIVAAKPEYNDTTVQCIALFYNDTNLFPSTSVLLLIQGIPASVTSLSATLTEETDTVTLNLNWDTVFSLNISNQEPDLWYQVDISSVLCGTLNTSQDDLLSLHNSVVYEPFYTHLIVPYNVSVLVVRIASANAAGSGGSSDPLNVTILLAPQTSHEAVETGVYFPRMDRVNISLKFLESEPACQLRTIDSYSAYVMSIDSGEVLSLIQNNVTQSSTNRLLHLSVEVSTNLIPTSRQYTAIIEGENSAGRANITETQFSTHHVLNVTISNSTLSGTILISATFTPGSNAIGYLAVLIGYDGSYFFTVAYRPDNTVTISDLPRSVYSAAVFDIGTNGVPASLAASTTVFSVSTRVSSTISMQANDPNFSVQKTLQGQVCITCSFPSVSRAKGCIALIHSPAKQAELTVHTIARTQSTNSTQLSTLVRECLDIPGADSVSVALFMWRSDGVIAQHPSTVVAEVMADSEERAKLCDSTCVYVVLVVAVSFVVVLTACVIFYLVLRHRRKLRDKTTSGKITMSKNSAYEEHMIPPRRVQKVDSPVTEPVYETII